MRGTVGPALHELMGKKAGSSPGYPTLKAMRPQPNRLG